MNMKKVILSAFFITGVAALIYEVIWFRVLHLVFGSSIYAISITLAAFLGGLAIGAWLFGAYADKIKNPLRIFGVVELGIGIYGLMILYIFNYIPLLYLNLYDTFHNSLNLFFMFQLLLCFGVLLVPTILMGGTLPILIKAYNKKLESLGEDIGELYSINNFGAIFGSFAGGFIFLPLIGIKYSSMFAASLNFLAAILIFYYLRNKNLIFVSSLVFLLFLVVTPPYNYTVLNTGVYFHTSDIETLSGWYENPETKILFFREGFYGSIMVMETSEIVKIPLFNREFIIPYNTTFFGTNKGLKINGKTQCGTDKEDMTTTTLLAGIPLLLHNDPKTALNIGLGCGLTLGILESYPLEKIDSVEIDPTIVKAARIFNDVHNNALDDLRSNLVITDARNFLLLTNEKYDIIVNEPPDPWMATSTNLFSEEYFEMMREHLNSYGIVSQWVPVFELSTSDFKIFYKTFHSVFPYTYGFISKIRTPSSIGINEDGKLILNEWEWSPFEIVLIGSMNPINIEPTINKKFNGSLKNNFRKVEIEDPMNYYFFSGEELEGFTKNTPVNTDNNPIIEFSVGKNMYTKDPLTVIREIERYKQHGF